MAHITARPAATIVVIRQQNDVLEILMLRRSAQVVAAPGAHVFPGGSVDDLDADVVRGGLFDGVDEAAAARRLDLEEGAVSYYCAAVRELFEETGLLLARDETTRTTSFDRERLARWRQELASGALTWTDLLRREGLRLALEDVEYFAHWVTPTGRPRQFDTRFFVVAAPPGQHPLVDDGEILEHQWTSARDALDRVARGEWAMLVPTQRTLAWLSAHDSVESVLRAAATARVRRIQPREVERDGRLVVVVPEDDDGPDAV